jgi:hypothetical protein
VQAAFPPCLAVESVMSDTEVPKYGTDPEITAVSDRLMVLIGQVVVEEVEKAQSEGKNLLAWQFGSLDAMTKHLSHALAGCVTLLRGQNLNPKDFVIFRRRVYRQLRPAVLALMNTELAKTGVKRDIPWPSEEERAGHA